MTGNALKPMRNVTFRLPADEFEILAGQAAKVGLSGPMHARELVRAGIHQWGHVEELHSLSQDVQQVRSMVLNVQADLRRVALAVLVACDMPSADARAWVEKHLGRNSGRADT